ncbi:MAG: asparaginase [Solirubrobacterales bacterium]|nr:asparaginase [Solirubrobacterales bacterium]
MPRIDYLATGGTIASVQDDSDSAGEPTLTAETLARSVPGIAEVAELRPAQFMPRPSPSITFADLLRLRDEIAHRVRNGAAGVVITQGTDTIEEAAFALDLLCAGSAPIVVTGAMRSPSLPGADGPGEPARRGTGGGEHRRSRPRRARRVQRRNPRREIRRQTYTSKPSAFRSRLTGPIGWLSEGQPVIVTRPVGRFCLDVPSGADVPPVALVRVALDDDGLILPALAAQGYRRVVIERFGGGHVTPPMVSRIERLARQIPVVLASRIGSGELLRNTYRYHVSETELLEIGAVPAGVLDGLEAGILLSLCLAADPAAENVAVAFQAIGMASTTSRIAGQPVPRAPAPISVLPKR